MCRVWMMWIILILMRRISNTTARSMNRKRLSETDAGSSVRWRNSVLLRNSSVKQRNQMNSRRENDRINRPLRLLQTRFL